MRALRRLLQVVAIVGTLMVGILAVALIVSQTPWFRNWLRRYIVRESQQYLNGDLSIGRLGGNLLFGVDLDNISVDVSGERVVAVKSLEMDYSLFELISKGMVLDNLHLSEPNIRLERDAEGNWNVLRLVKEQKQEANRTGPMKPLQLQSVEVSDATVSIDDRMVGTSGVKLPQQIDDLDLKGSFAYEPVHYSLDIDHVSFRGSSPQIALKDLAGKLAVRDDNLYVQQLKVVTGESSLAIDGVVQKYLSQPVLKVTTKGKVSLPEIGRVVPAAAGYKLHPAIDLKADGPLDRLGVDVNVNSEAGNIRGTVVADVKAPGFGVRGDLDLDRLNLAPILKDPAQRSDLTGHAKLDVRIASAPASAPVADRVSGTFAFAGPRAAAAGYDARDVRVTGSMRHGRIDLDGRAAAYGGAATAKGFIVAPTSGRPLAFDLVGKADHVDLRGLPASTGAPQLSTNLSVSNYHISGSGRSITGTARLNRSTVEGATIATGTSAQFEANGPGNVSYAANGSISGLNLYRIGRGLRIAALAKPEYDSQINGRFDVKGAGTKLSAMTLDATGTLSDSTLMGGRVPALNFDTHLAGGGLKARADGRFEGFDPGRVSGRKDLAGSVTGTINGNVQVANLSAPLTPDSIAADAKVTIAKSTVGGLEITNANVDGTYASNVGDIRQLHVDGPDLKTDASGRLALDRTSASNLKYHVESANVGQLAGLAGQTGVGGAVVLDGTLTGNAASLQTTGNLAGSDLTYQNNNALDLKSQYTVTVPDLKFANATVDATTTGTFVKAGGLTINELTAKTTYKEQTIGFTTTLKERTRQLDATGQVILHPEHQEIHLPQLSVRTQGIVWSTAGNQAAIDYGADRIELRDFHLVSGQQSLEVSGAFSLDKAKPSPGITAHVRNVDLKQLETLLLQDRGFTGTLTADATIAGTSAAPEVKGRFDVANGGFQTYRYNSLKADVDYTSAGIKLDATLQQSPTEYITAKGFAPATLWQANADPGQHIPASGSDRLDLQVKSSALSLGVIQGFTNQVTNVAGTLQADVRLEGSGRDPHLAGYIDVRNGAFGVPATGVSYTGLTTRIDLQPDRVHVGQFQIRDENGDPLNVSGDLAVHARELGNVNVSIDSSNFKVINNELGKVHVDTHLKLTGEVRRPQIVGEIRPSAGRIEVDQLLQMFYSPYSTEGIPDTVSAEETVQTAGSAHEATEDALHKAQKSMAPAAAQQQAAAPAAAAPAGAGSPIALDVHVKIPDNLVLRANDLRPGGPSGASLGKMNITLGGDMQIRKQPGGQLAITGVVDTVRGTYEFQGRRFDLVRGGSVRFTGNPQPNPLLDVSATRQIPNTGVTAQVHITGTAKEPQLALSSTPPLDEADILALIVFNRPVNELGTGQRSSLAATAGGIATGFIAEPLGQSIGKALDLDLFEISTTTDTGDPGAAVTIGQQIGDKAYIKLRQQFGDRSVSEFQLEYRLANFLRLQTSVAPETSGAANRVGQRRVERAGVDLLFFFSY